MKAMKAMKAMKRTVAPGSLAGLVLVYSTLFPGAPAAAQVGNPNVVIDRNAVRGAPGAADDTALLKGVIARRRLEQKAADLYSAFPATPSGRAVAEIALLVPYGLRPADQMECLLMAKRRGLVQQNGPGALDAIQAGLSGLPPRYVAERQFLIQLAVRLPMPAPQVQVLKNFLAAEIQRPAALDPDGRVGRSFFNGAIALDALIELTNDPDQIESILVPALKAKTNPSERELLLARYHTAFPQRAERWFPAFGLPLPTR